ncbi:MAG TPA: alcohol dehydrogenase catalytic domain-containing protein, partial [Solirubrobacteraceae bacterium]|nr:alcohol dehydrogenase catalytic domain-containing protein [Solirubrobacteraceae bacterium]
MIGLAKVAPGEGHVEVAERPERSPDAGEVALDVHAVGICGTDLHIWLGEYPSVPPVTMGHEVCGVVAELGEGVDPSWAGARVAVETFFSTCGECPYCRAGKLSVCEQRRSIGTHVDGGFAPRLVLPARNLHRVPEALPDEAAALSEPLACVCNSL